MMETKEAIGRLKKLALEDNRMKYPTFPEHCRPAFAYSDKKANGLTKCITDFVNFSGYQAERISTMGRVIDNRESYINVIGQTVTMGSTKYIPGTGTKGSADISATIMGRSVKIEVKIGADRQSPNQKSYQMAIEKAGGVYIIAKTFPDFLEWYDNFIILHS